jgi:hypothetical protein
MTLTAEHMALITSAKKRWDSGLWIENSELTTLLEIADEMGLADVPMTIGQIVDVVDLMARGNPSLMN